MPRIELNCSFSFVSVQLTAAIMLKEHDHHPDELNNPFDQDSWSKGLYGSYIGYMVHI